MLRFRRWQEGRYIVLGARCRQATDICPPRNLHRRIRKPHATSPTLTRGAPPTHYRIPAECSSVRLTTMYFKPLGLRVRVIVSQERKIHDFVTACTLSFIEMLDKRAVYQTQNPPTRVEA